MEGPAQLLTLALVLWDGWEGSVKQVGEGLISLTCIWADMYCQEYIRDKSVQLPIPAWYIRFL